MKVDHIGYLVKDIEKSIKEFEKLSYVKVTDIFTDNIPDGEIPARNVFICFLENEMTRVELVSPIDENSDVYSTIKRQGEGPYHICYRVGDLEAEIKVLRASGWMVMKRPAKAIALDNSKVVFMFRLGVGIIELVEDRG